MRANPDQYDAELLLRLYELRREEKLRLARDWFVREFQVASVDEYMKGCPPGTKENDYFCMVLSYWEMAASIVNHNLIKEDFFFENTSEFWVVWTKVQHLAPEAREQWKYPRLWKNLETLAQKYEKWMTLHAPEALEEFRRRLAETSAKK